MSTANQHKFSIHVEFPLEGIESSAVKHTWKIIHTQDFEKFYQRGKFNEVVGITMEMLHSDTCELDEHFYREIMVVPYIPQTLSTILAPLGIKLNDISYINRQEPKSDRPCTKIFVKEVVCPFLDDVEGEGEMKITRCKNSDGLYFNLELDVTFQCSSTVLYYSISAIHSTIQRAVTNQVRGVFQHIFSQIASYRNEYFDKGIPFVKRS